MRLFDLRILLVDGDPDSVEVLASYLESEGADVESAFSAADGLRAVQRSKPDVVVSELELPDLAGNLLLLALRALPGCAELPAIALTAHTGLAARAQALAAGFHKYLVKPVLLDDVTAAVSSLGRGHPSLEAPAGGVSRAALRQSLLAHDYRALLAALNGSTQHRYSSIFRFDGDRLLSVWTFDRTSPDADSFPVEVSLADSYCAYMYQSVAPLVIEDSLADSRVLRYRRRHEIRAFCGVPLFSADGTLYGALCHFDNEPRHVSEAVMDLLAGVAYTFRTEVTTADRNGAASGT